MTTDPGVRDTLSFMIGRDTFHQHQCIRAIEELEADGLESHPVPSRFPRELENANAASQF